MCFVIAPPPISHNHQSVRWQKRKIKDIGNERLNAHSHTRNSIQFNWTKLKNYQLSFPTNFEKIIELQSLHFEALARHTKSNDISQKQYQVIEIKFKTHTLNKTNWQVGGAREKKNAIYRTKESLDHRVNKRVKERVSIVGGKFFGWKQNRKQQWIKQSESSSSGELKRLDVGRAGVDKGKSKHTLQTVDKFQTMSKLIKFHCCCVYASPRYNTHTHTKRETT